MASEAEALASEAKAGDFANHQRGAIPDLLRMHSQSLAAADDPGAVGLPREVLADRLTPHVGAQAAQLFAEGGQGTTAAVVASVAVAPPAVSVSASASAAQAMFNEEAAFEAAAAAKHGPSPEPTLDDRANFCG